MADEANELCEGDRREIRMSLVSRSKTRSEESPSREVISCAFEPCGFPAKIRLYPKNGGAYMNVCINCYDKIFVAEARRYVERLGLKSRGEKAGFCRKNNLGVKPGHEMDWAIGLRARYVAGKTLSLVQITLASAALGEVWSDGKVNQISKEVRTEDAYV